MESKSEKINCLLFTLTGFGNSLIQGLLESDQINNIIVITRKEKGNFPHYPCENILDLCNRYNIEYEVDVSLQNSDFIGSLSRKKIDIVLCATYHQLIPNQIINLAKFESINIHPSILPNYRGPTPTNWSILFGEKTVGISYHRLSGKFDLGDILHQEEIQLNKSWNDGDLRLQLALLAKATIDPFIKNLLRSNLITIKQDINKGSSFPNITSVGGIKLIKSRKWEPVRLQKALTPYPGFKFYEKNSEL